MARYLPSGAVLPAVWNKEMDRFICYCEGLGNVNNINIIRLLKQKFPQLAHAVISEESIERRIMMLEQMDNDYFVLGMEIAVARAEAAGFVLPPMDLEEYAAKPDAEVEATEVSHTITRFGVDAKSNFANVLTSLVRVLMGLEATPSP